MQWKEIVADYFSFTRKDRVAILVIVLLMLIVIFAPVLFSNSSHQKPGTPDTAWMTTVKKLEQKETENSNQPFSDQTNKDDAYSYQYDRSKNNQYNQSKGELFYFDPNTLSQDGWKKLGLRDKTIQTILNYL